MSSHLSPAIFNSMLTISIPKKAAVYRHAKINGHGLGRSVRIPAHTTPRVAFQPSATMMVDGTSKDVVRPVITSFTPCMWGDIFSKFSLDDQVQQKYSEEIEALKKEVRSMLMAVTSAKLMILIDKLERLGLAYHFETEIEDKLKQVYDSAEEEEEDSDLFTSALRFRLLRQHQHHVSCNVFAKFVEKDNKLKESLCSDVEGLLSLYEAAHVRIHDDNVLEEAVTFTTHHLSRMLLQLESPLKEQVQQALQYPLHKSPTILTLRSYIDIYENDGSRDELLLRLAKLNFNFMQNIYKSELSQLTTWWKNLNLTSKLPYFRDRLVESYVSAMAAYNFEPQYSLVRIFVAKLYIMIACTDDTHDNYATPEESQLFMRVQESWNMDEIDLLPNYLKLVYKFTMSISEEFEREAEKQGKTYVIPHYIERMKQTGRCYAKDQKWVMERRIPSYEESMKNSLFLAYMYVTSMVAFTVMESGTEETINWLLSGPKIFITSSNLCRLLNDLAGHQRESKDGTMLTPMDYYMRDNGVSMEEARSAFKESIEDGWKHMNAAWVNSTMVPKDLLVHVLNHGRISEILYKNEEDGYTSPEKNMAPIIAALLLDPVLI